MIAQYGEPKHDLLLSSWHDTVDVQIRHGGGIILYAVNISGVCII